MAGLASLLATQVHAAAAAGGGYDATYGGLGGMPAPCPPGWRGCDGPTSLRLWPG